jgi:hypothetical protein
MTYDHWKTTNPQDEWLGPELLPYDAVDDFAKSIEVAYEAVRERVANGGPPWSPKPFGSWVERHQPAGVAFFNPCRIHDGFLSRALRLRTVAPLGLDLP